MIIKLNWEKVDKINNMNEKNRIRHILSKIKKGTVNAEILQVINFENVCYICEYGNFGQCSFVHRFYSYLNEDDKPKCCIEAFRAHAERILSKG